MRRVALAVLAVAMASCGVDFAGTYSGPGSISGGTCSDGSTFAPVNGEISITVKELGSSEVEFTLFECTGVRGTVAGNTASIKQTVCPPQKLKDGGNSTMTIRTGTLVLNGNSLTLSAGMVNQLNLASGASGTCPQTASGTLARR